MSLDEICLMIQRVVSEYTRSTPAHLRDCDVLTGQIVRALRTAPIPPTQGDDQPNMNYAETIEYAKRMGLPTEFPVPAAPSPNAQSELVECCVAPVGSGSITEWLEEHQRTHESCRANPYVCQAANVIRKAAARITELEQRLRQAEQNAAEWELVASANKDALTDARSKDEPA